MALMACRMTAGNQTQVADDAIQPRIFIIAGEPSGDVIAAEIMAALGAQSPQMIQFAGIGGKNMAAVGLQSRVDIRELSLFGVFELLPRLRRLRQIRDETLAAIAQFQPDIVLTVDSKGFAFSLAQKLARHRGTGDRPHIMHVVAPTVWAYRPQRARKIAGFLDHLLVLFPFEPPYFTVHGLATSFIGHPAAYRPKGDGVKFRLAHGLPLDVPVLGLCPGSRQSEIQRLLPGFLQTAKLLISQNTALRIVLPTVSAVADGVQAMVAESGLEITVLVDQPSASDAFAAFNVALAASGTVTLELALAGVPSVVGYRANLLTAFLATCFVDRNAVVLSNKILGRQVQPAFFQWQCTPKNLAAAVTAYFADPQTAVVAAEIADQLRAALQVDNGLQTTADAAAKVVLTALQSVSRA